MSTSDYFKELRNLNLTLTEDVSAKRAMHSKVFVPLYYSSTSESSDSNITQEMFEEFVQELCKTRKDKKSTDNWFTHRMNYYRESGILNVNVLKKIQHEEEEIDDELDRNSKQINHKAWRNAFLNKAICDCASHLRTWHSLFINKIHKNKWLLECKKLHVNYNMIALTDTRQDIKYVKVPTADANPWKQKANQVMRYVDLECGFDERYSLHLGNRQPPQRQIYLAVLKSTVIGCIAAEPVSKAYYLEENPGDVKFVNTKCDVKCGINRIWVNIGYRRRKVARALFKIVQYYFLQNGVLNEKDFALSTVTEDGLFFAHTVLKSRKIPIYMESPSWKNKRISTLQNNIVSIPTSTEKQQDVSNGN